MSTNIETLSLCPTTDDLRNQRVARGMEDCSVIEVQADAEEALG
jgi:hypothetical protein